MKTVFSFLFYIFLACSVTYGQLTKHIVYKGSFGEITEQAKATSVVVGEKNALGDLEGKAICYVVQNGEQTEQILWKGAYNNNKMHGEFVEYYLSGEKKEEGTYRSGQKIGKWIFGLDKKKGLSVWEYTDEEHAKIVSFWDSTGTQTMKDGTGGYYDINYYYIESGSYQNHKKNREWKGLYLSGKPYYQETWLEGELEEGTSYEEDSDKKYTYTIFQEIPEFVGGQKAMASFLKTNFKYPKQALRKSIKGKVLVRFVVDTLGIIKDVTVINPVHPLLDEEAVRLVKLMPNWKAGIQRGKKVAVYFLLPIVFSFK